MTIPAITPAEFPYFPYDGFTFSLGRSEGEHAWLSGHSGARQDPDLGKMTVTGGMRAQATVMYEKIGCILDAAGMGFGDVTHLVENVTMAGLEFYGEAEEVRRSVLGSGEPALSTVVVNRLVRRAALIEVEVTAQRGGGRGLDADSTTGWHRGHVVEAGGTVYLPTIVPVGRDGRILYEGDFEGQYRYCVAQAGQLLAEVGLDLTHAATVVDYSIPATIGVHQAACDVRGDLCGPIYPATASLVMSQMQLSGVLVSVDVSASRQAPQLVDPGWARYRDQAASPAVRAGRNVFISGISSVDQGSGDVREPGNLEAQAKVAYGSLLSMLGHLGAGPADLIRTIEYVAEAGLAEYRAVAAVRQNVLAPPWPASVGAVSQGHHGEGLLLEVLPFAVLPEA